MPRQIVGESKNIVVELEGFDELSDRLRGIEPKMRRNFMRGGMRALLAHLKKGAAKRIPSRTGALRRSLKTSTRIFPAQGIVEGRLRTGAAISGGKLKGRDAWYGHIIERGAKPHVIEPSTRKALRIGGRFFARVKHPGIAARRFMERTAAEDLPRGRELFYEYVTQRLKEEIEGGR